VSLWRKLSSAISIVLIVAACSLTVLKLERQSAASEKAPGTSTQKTEKNYSQIEEGLYLGGYVDEPPPGTRAVLNVCQTKDPYSADSYCWHGIPDAAPAPSLDWLREQVDFVDKEIRAGHPVYIHCYAGISRSAMVTAAYLMVHNHWTRDEAMKYLRSKRPIVSPNSAFMELLEKWEKTTRG
jgi:protein-tyrosine phosphatase